MEFEILGMWLLENLSEWLGDLNHQTKIRDLYASTRAANLSAALLWELEKNIAKLCFSEELIGRSEIQQGTGASFKF